MEEELLKRNTDCVYFLASPFTCKKGAECEYRHSEMARLNPRDCWYWLSGNCLNPTCGFRHPPLEVHTEVSSEAAAPLLNQSSAPAIKTTVPCFYYFSGFCNKGDRCPFLHEPDDAYAGKQQAANSTANLVVQPLDRKTSQRTDTEPAPEKKPSSSSEMTMKGSGLLQVHQKAQVQKPLSDDKLELKSSAQASVSEYEETDAAKTVSLKPAECSDKSEGEPSVGSERSSEELIDENMVRDEYLESSPGFDVLVDGKTDDLAYDNDSEYLHAPDGSDGDRECLYMQHGYVDQNGFDETVYFRNGLYDPSEHIDDEYRGDHGKYSPRHSLDRKVGHFVRHKRKFMFADFPVDSHDSMDLRDYLRKRRMVGGLLEAHNFRHDLACRRDERKERVQRQARHQQLHGRVTSKMERSGLALARRTVAVDAHQRDRPRNPRRNGSREYDGMRRCPLATEGRRRSSPKRERCSQGSATFVGPKSLAEIKQEKRVGDTLGNGCVDFDGPKPLREILKEKRKATSSRHGDFSSTF